VVAAPPATEGLAPTEAELLLDQQDQQPRDCA
jgi:hypothetical protein